ncbi:MAG: hypothetical protein CMI18_13745 [Opitutaceae bacterium]|nr:hypothetical protein [Opitutaceae bacterium]|tara:strand:+ start:897 stop:1205 length:309 start_codon:yes stop_codon:yes gene_type:complete
MTYLNLNFDILVGLSKLLMAWKLARNKVSNIAAPIWTILGLVLFLNIVVIAILSMSTPLRAFDNKPATFVTQFPYVWLPAFHVQAALFGHLLVFRALKRGSA